MFSCYIDKKTAKRKKFKKYDFLLPDYNQNRKCTTR